MTTTSEDVLLLSLTDTDSLESLVTIGLDLEAIPTVEVRPVVQWAIDRFFESGRTTAPTRAAMLETWGQVIDDAGVELLPEDEDADTVEWAIDALKGQYIHYQFQQFLKNSGMEAAQTAPPDRVTTLSRHADELFTLSQRVQPRHQVSEAADGISQALRAYEGRAASGQSTRGMTFGLAPIDEHTFGIHPGEVAMLAAGPKTGKSFFLDNVAKNCWVDGHDTVLYTLENSIEMTWDRIICLHLGIDSRRWQRGQCEPEEVERVRWFVNDVMPDMPAQLHVLSPDSPSERTMSAMVRKAQILGGKRLFIDQLTHVAHPDPGRKARHEIVFDLMKELKDAIRGGKTPIPCLLAHQINRDGMAAARKSGHLVMDNMAESAGVERTADWVFSLFQSGDDRIAGEVLFQILAARREDTKAWKLVWQPSVGMVAAAREVEIEQ